MIVSTLLKSFRNWSTVNVDDKITPSIDNRVEYIGNSCDFQFNLLHVTWKNNHTWVHTKVVFLASQTIIEHITMGFVRNFGEEM